MAKLKVLAARQTPTWLFVVIGINITRKIAPKGKQKKEEAETGFLPHMYWRAAQSREQRKMIVLIAPGQRDNVQRGCYSIDKGLVFRSVFFLNIYVSCWFLLRYGCAGK